MYQKKNTRGYKSNSGAILDTDAKIIDYISRITIVPEIKSTGCLTDAVVIGDGIIIKGDVVDVLSDTSPGKNIITGTCWVNKV